MGDNLIQGYIKIDLSRVRVRVSSKQLLTHRIATQAILHDHLDINCTIVIHIHTIVWASLAAASIAPQHPSPYRGICIILGTVNTPTDEIYSGNNHGSNIRGSHACDIMMHTCVQKMTDYLQCSVIVH